MSMDKVIINCDWLQYSVILEEDCPELICPDGYRIEVLQGNNIFRYRAIVTDSMGIKWLTLLWSPYSSLLNKRLMTVQVGNQLLYYQAVAMSYKLLTEIVECHFNSCGRVDICADFLMDDDKLAVLRHLNSGHYYVQGKSEGSTWWHTINDTSGDYIHKKSQLHCLSWGSKNTDIKVKCYHKSREQGMLAKEPKPEKPYIIDLWRDIGWDVTKVWRLEFSINGTGKYRWKGESINLDKVKSHEWLTHTFYSLYEGRFIVRENQGKRKGHKNCDPRKDFLMLPSESDVLVRSLGTTDHMQASDAVKVLRKLMAQIESPVVMSNETLCGMLCDSVLTLVDSNRLGSYFHTKFGDDVRVYLQRVMDDCGSGIFEVDGKPSKTWM